MRTLRGYASSDQDGAVAVTFAIMLVALLGLGMVAVDVGSILATKRDVAADTDAAALAGAKYLAEASDAECAAAAAAADPFSTPMGSVVGEFLVKNRSNEHRELALTVSCGAAGSATGRVTVAAKQPATTTFAGIFGMGDVVAAADTTAQFGPADVGAGLRPLSICLSHPAVEAYLNTGAPGPYTLMYSKNGDAPPPSARLPVIAPLSTHDGAGSGNLVADCAEDPGNWGLTCFAGPSGPSGCGASTLEDYIRDGYPEDVEVNRADPTKGDCQPETESTDESCNEGGGVRDSLEADFAFLHCNGGNPTVPALWPAANTCEYQFPILGLESPSIDGSGNYYPAAFLGVVLRDSYIQGNKYAWFTFEFTKLTVSGRIGPGGSAAGGVRAVNICGIDHDGASDYCVP